MLSLSPPSGYNRSRAQRQRCTRRWWIWSWRWWVPSPFTSLTHSHFARTRLDLRSVYSVPCNESGRFLCTIQWKRCSKNSNFCVVHKYKKILRNMKAYRQHYLSLTVAWCYWLVRLVRSSSDTVLRSEHWPERTVLHRRCSASRKAIWRRSWITGSQPWIRPTWWVPSRCIPTHSATYL